MELRAISGLRVHPRNAQIYGDGADAALLESVRHKGVLEALLITPQGLVISGHRRLDAARRAGVAAVKVDIYEGGDEMEILALMLAANTQREKTEEQRGREYRAAKEVEAALSRRGRPPNGNNELKSTHYSGRDVPAQRAPQARDKAAQRTGQGWQKGERSAAVVGVIDQLEGEGKTDEAVQLRLTLNGQSPARAYNAAIKAGHIIPPDREKAPAWAPVSLAQWRGLGAEERAAVLARRDAGAKMNKQSSTRIEWAQWSWNPVTGCEHNCSYCYARDIAHKRHEEGALAYVHDFAPALQADRLGAPAATRVPPRASQDVGFMNVFTCSMADLFGKWVPREWIEAVLAEVRTNPQWNFLFLTKFPIRLAEFEFPDNAWLGTTVDAQARIPNAEKAFARLKGGIKWLSCEPMLERLTFNRLDLFDWVVIGGASGSSQTPEFRPPREWVDHLEAQCAAAGCAVYEKDNLWQRRRDYPGQPSRPPVNVPAAFKMGYLQRDVLPGAGARP